MSGLDDFNGLPEREAEEQLRSCLDVQRWIDTILEGRPYADRDALLGVARNAASDLSDDELSGALARHHVKLAAPRRVLLLGEAAVRVMTGLALPAARGRVHAIDLDGSRVNAVATYHPRYLLQRPAAKAGAWADLQLLVEGYA